MCVVGYMNGCRGDPSSPVGVRETLTLPAVATPAVAMTQLCSAVAALECDPPQFGSGIIRLEVSIFMCDLWG